jgi:hypothetical protein
MDRDIFRRAKECAKRLECVRLAGALARVKSGAISPHSKRWRAQHGLFGSWPQCGILTSWTPMNRSRILDKLLLHMQQKFVHPGSWCFRVFRGPSTALRRLNAPPPGTGAWVRSPLLNGDRPIGRGSQKDRDGCCRSETFGHQALRGNYG